MRLASRLSEVSRSEIAAVMDRLAAMRAEGRTCVDLAQGEVEDAPINRHAKRGAINAIEAGLNKYAPTAGMPDVRDAVCSKLRRDNGLEFERREVIITNGAKQALYQCIQATCGPGDEVLIPAPYWVSFIDQVKLSGATPVIVPTMENRLRLSAALLRQYITTRSRALILNTPGNPSGVVLSQAELDEIAGVVLENDIIVIADEVYEAMVFSGSRHVSIASLSTAMRENTITIGAVSKTYAMTGWRVGYAAGPQDVIGAMVTVQGHLTSCVNVIGQQAAASALLSDQREPHELAYSLEQRCARAVELLNDIDGVHCDAPEGGFFVFPQVRGLFGRPGMAERCSTSAEFALSLLSNTGIAVVPGSAFGAEGYIRVNCGVPIAALEEALHTVRSALVPVNA